MTMNKKHFAIFTVLGITTAIIVFWSRINGLRILPLFILAIAIIIYKIASEKWMKIVASLIIVYIICRLAIIWFVT
jgi:hypothetical protein